MLLMAISDRLKEARLRLRLTQEQLAKKSGVSRSSIAQYEVGGSNPPIEQLRKLASALAVPIQDLLDVDTGNNAVTPTKRSNLAGEAPMPRIEFEEVPIYGAISAHASAYSDSDVVDTELLPKARGDRRQWGRYVKGQCMEPEFIEGDIAIFEDRGYEDGHGVHAFSQGEDTFKIFRLIDGKPWLYPTNDLQGSLPIDATEWNIKGVCTKRIRLLDKGVRDTREYPSGYKYRF